MVTSPLPVPASAIMKKAMWRAVPTPVRREPAAPAWLLKGVAHRVRAGPLAGFVSTPAAPACPCRYRSPMFGVDEALIRRIMGVALDKGGDYCDLYFQNRVAHSIGLEDNIVNNAFARVDFGVGIRVLKGDQTGYSYTEEITPKAMELAAETAGEHRQIGKTRRRWN